MAIFGRVKTIYVDDRSFKYIGFLNKGTFSNLTHFWSFFVNCQTRFRGFSVTSGSGTIITAPLFLTGTKVTIQNIRSIRGEYKLTNKQKTDVYVETKSESVKASLEPLSSFISALSSSGNVTFSSDVPAGCVVSVVNDDVNVHIMLKVNFSYEN